MSEESRAKAAGRSRLEPEITSIDAAAFYASAAISLKRIADALEAKNKLTAREMHTQEVTDVERHARWLVGRGLADLIEDPELRARAVKATMPQGEPDGK